MNLKYSHAVYLLLVVLGISILWTAGGMGGPETNVQQYTAFEVTYEDDELVLTDVDTGDERRGAHVSTINVDENIVCLPSHTRECNLAWKEYEGEINVSGISSEFRFAYFDDEFYRITRTHGPGSEFEYGQIDASDAFASLALDRDRLTETEREVLDEGKIASTDPAPHTNRIVESGGEYYTILQTGTKTYGDGGSFCGSSGDGFCDRADTVRWVEWVSGLGFRILGVLGVLAGAGGLLKDYRSSERTE